MPSQFDFNDICGLIPHDMCWGEPLTPEVAHAIADAVIARMDERRGDPVAYWIEKAGQFCIADPNSRPFAKDWKPLYSSPKVQRLTEDRIREILTPVFIRQDQASIHWPDIFEEVRAIENALTTTSKGGTA